MFRDADEPQVVALPSEGPFRTALTVCTRAGERLHRDLFSGTIKLNGRTRLADINRDHAPDIVQLVTGAYRVIENRTPPDGHSFAFVDHGLRDLTPQVSADAMWVQDFNGDGLTDIVARLSSSLLVWHGLGQLEFTTEGTRIPMLLQDMRPLTGLARFELNFLDANRDGLSDVLLRAGTSVFLFVNHGDALVETPVPALSDLSGSIYYPIAADLSGSGEREVLFIESGEAMAVRLTAAGTALLSRVDDGKGTAWSFSYKRAPAEQGVRSRTVVVASIAIDATGHGQVRQRFDYAGTVLHRAGLFLQGFGEVHQTGPLSATRYSFINDDGHSSLLSGSEIEEPGEPGLSRYRSLSYDDALSSAGVRLWRLQSEQRGWAVPGAAPIVGENTTYVTYERDVCAVDVRTTNTNGDVQRARVLSTPKRLELAPHCLVGAETVVASTVGSDGNLDVPTATEITVDRNEIGQPVEITRKGDAVDFTATADHTLRRTVVPGHAVALQGIAYDDMHRLSALTATGVGTTTASYDAETGLLASVTAPTGVQTRATYTGDGRDLLELLETDRGDGVVYRQYFAYDGLERLAGQWDSMHGGSATEPLVTHSYVYAQGNRPASVHTTSWLTPGHRSADEVVELLSARGAKLGALSPAETAWVASNVMQRDDAQGLSTGFADRVLDGLDAPKALALTSLFADASAVVRSQKSGLTLKEEHRALVQTGVERQVSTSVTLSAEGTLMREEPWCGAVRCGALASSRTPSCGRRGRGEPTRAPPCTQRAASVPN